MVEWTPSNPTLVTPALYLAIVLRLQFMLFKVTEDTKYLDNMIEAIGSAVPDTRPDGVKAFLAFDDEAYSNGLRGEEIEQIKDQLKKTVPTMPDLDTAVIQDVRRIVKDNKWSNRLPYRQFSFFLDLCQWRVRPESADEVKTAEVDKVLNIVLMRDRHV
ncbi:hypothetical protein KC332_g8224 [Hortaea werneckii]|nr:hypothetical protein KC350_g5657 [Hortaea werneckii]KAI6849387.1 hypothetical protein KC358_g1180 [Hortaea werneckii]KAI6943729.1 hypothetical protein KC341_g1277 [Hortaea werneckii]KAI6945683.1 hypothetical protein KC348_g3654 [Hortaea werneckii]KAI6981719.1 hypothetical protein KC321_g1047 [Hortaea werneckii]